jgi:hypothetical protein
LSANSNQPPDGSRRRIVIPLGPKQEGAPAKARIKSPGQKRAANSPHRSRAGKVLAVLGITVVTVVLLAAGGIFFWWQHYKTTPAYSLALLVDAAQRDDMATVDTIIDTDKIVDNFAGEVIDKATGRYGAALGPGARQQIEALAPKLSPAIRQNARATLTTRVKEISRQADHKPFILVALGISYLMNVEVNGDTAKATAVVQGQQVELDLSRAGDGWKVVAFRDEQLVQRAIDQVIKDLPAIGSGSGTRTTDAPKQHNNGLPPLREPKLP